MPASPPPPNSPPLPSADQRSTDSLEPELAPEDFYYDGPYLVFTAAYHLKRGHCCNSDCRHCPYRDLD